MIKIDTLQKFNLGLLWIKSVWENPALHLSLYLRFWIKTGWMDLEHSIMVLDRFYDVVTCKDKSQKVYFKVMSCNLKIKRNL